jgi:hypothetical protein
MPGWGVLVFMLGIATVTVGGVELAGGDLRALPVMLLGAAFFYLAVQMDAGDLRDGHEE